MTRTKNKNLDAPYGVETRSYECNITTRSDDKHGDVIEGLPIVFDSVANIGGGWYETIARGALDNCDLKDVMLLVNHERGSIPLARSRNNNDNSTMQLSIEKDGLHIRADIDKENPKGAELLSAVKRGDITGMSFGFIVDKDEWKDLDSTMPTRTITSIRKVVEVSAVNNPAYEATSISSRSLEVAREALESERSALEKAKEDARIRAEIMARLQKKD